jgi:hypothetical protein
MEISSGNCIHLLDQIYTDQTSTPGLHGGVYMLLPRIFMKLEWEQSLVIFSRFNKF